MSRKVKLVPRRFHCCAVGAPRLLLLPIIVIVTFTTAASGKDTPSPPPARASKTAPAPFVQPSSSLDSIVGALATGLARGPAEVFVASAPLTTDVVAPRAEALVAQLTKLLAGRLSAVGKFSTAPTDLSKARKRAALSRGLVYLRPRIQAGKLYVPADGYPVPTTVWARARAPEPGPVVHSHAVAPLDAEVRSYLKPIPFSEPVIAKYEGADPGILALGCGDLDGDGASDLVTMTRSRVLQVRLRQGKVVRVREASWAQLAPIAPVPMRQPIGFATIVAAHGSASARAYLDVAITDRAGSVRLDAQLRPVTKLRGLAVPAGRATACTNSYDHALGSGWAACVATDASPPLPQLRRRPDAIASSHLSKPNGKGGALVLVRAKGAAFLRESTGKETMMGRVGAQLALGDLDQDGAPELAPTMDVLSPKSDALIVRTLLQSGTVKPRFRIRAPSGINALAMCPPDGPGRAPLVVATAKQLWVIR